MRMFVEFGVGLKKSISAQLLVGLSNVGEGLPAKWPLS